MAAMTYIDRVKRDQIECTTDRLVLRLKSDGEDIKIMFGHHAALMLVELLKTQSWPLHCAPDGEIVPIKPKAPAKGRA